jgi:hypothetical protein
MADEEIDNALLKEEYAVLKRRGVPDTDPRIAAIRRISKKQKAPLGREGLDFPMQLKFPVKRREDNG